MMAGAPAPGPLPLPEGFDLFCGGDRRPSQRCCEFLQERGRHHCHYTTGFDLVACHLGGAADEWFFVWPMYIFFVLPMSMWILHDVIDVKWRPLMISRFWYSAYTVLNVVFMFLALIYFCAQLSKCEPDNKESAALLVAFVLNILAALKVARGRMVGQMLAILARAFVLVRGGERECWAGSLSEMVSCYLMDDDWPGTGPRIRWIWLLFRVFMPGKVDILNVHAIVDLHEYVLMISAWAWRCHSQEDSMPNEEEQLCWLVHGLDRGNAVSFMLTYGSDLRVLDDALTISNVGNIDIAVKQAYTPVLPTVRSQESFRAGGRSLEEREGAVKEALPPSAMLAAAPEHGPLCWVQSTLRYTLQVAKISVACVLKGRQLYSKSRPTISGVWGAGVLLAEDDELQEGHALRRISAGAARGGLVTMMMMAAKSLFMEVPVKLLQLHNEDPLSFIEQILENAAEVEDPKAAHHNVRFDSKGEGGDADVRPRFTDWQLKHLAQRTRNLASHLSDDDAAEHFRRLGAVSVNKEALKKDPPQQPPVFLIAYSISLVSLLYLASEASEAEQAQALSLLPPFSYKAVGVPRMALVAAISLSRKLAHLGSLRQTQPQALESPALLGVCSLLLESGDRLMLHMAAMCGAHGSEVGGPLALSWAVCREAFRPPAGPARGVGAPGEADPVLTFLKTFQRIGQKMLEDVAVARVGRKQAPRRLAVKWHLDKEVMDPVAVMMALTFSSVLCAAHVMVANKGTEVLQEQGSRGEPARGPPPLHSLVEPGASTPCIELIALYNAVMLGWEYMLWQVRFRAKKDALTTKELQDKKVTDMLQTWGVVGYTAGEDGSDTNERALLNPVALARVMAGTRYPELSSIESVFLHYEGGYTVGKKLLQAYEEIVRYRDSQAGIHESFKGKKLSGSLITAMSNPGIPELYE